MVVALILSAASLAIAAVGVLLADCSSSLLDVVAGDPVQLCASVSSLGMTPNPWMGVMLMVVGALGLFAVWAPARKRRATKADLASIAALKRNLDRVDLSSNAIKEAMPVGGGLEEGHPRHHERSECGGLEGGRPPS